MLYDSYKLKLSKWKQIFDKLWKFRLLFLAAFVLILAAIGSLMGVTGMVYGEACPASLIYGEHIAPSSKAFMRQTEYQYRPLGASEWSFEEPRRVGKYELRAVSKSVIGTKTYGEVFEYEIFPVDTSVEIENNTLVYGNDPEFVADLKFGDRVVVDSYDCTYLSTRLAEITASDIRIVSEAGDDVTDCYNFSVLTEKVKIAPRPVTVKTQSAEFVYDGQSHDFTALEFTSELKPLDAHEIKPVGVSSFTEVGEFDNVIKSLEFYENGENVSEFYDVSFEYGKIDVSKRPVSIQTGSGEWTYDGAAHDCALFDVVTTEEYGLLEGSTVEVKDTTKITDVLDDEQSCDNVLTFTILDSDGKDVTKNYDINGIYGTLKIARRQIKAVTGSLDEVYDGNVKSNTDITIMPVDDTDFSAFIEGQTFSAEIAEIVGVTDVTDTPVTNKLEFIWHIFGDGVEKTNNYALIETIYGTLNVTARHIDIQTVSNKWIYDGATHSDEGLEVASESELGLVSGHGLKAITSAPATINKVGEVTNSYNFEVRVLNSQGEDKTENYAVDVKGYGKLEVVKREITIATKSAEWYYDAKSHEEKDVEVTSVLSLPEGMEIVPAFTKEVTLTEVEWDEQNNVKSVSNDLGMTVTIKQNGEAVTDNFEVTIAYGNIKVNPRPITVEYLTEDFIYDGTEHELNKENTDFRIGGLGIVEGQTYAYDSCTKAKDVHFKEGAQTEEASYSNLLEGFRVMEGEKDKSKNYAITNEAGSFKVLLRPLTVRTISETFTYDGSEHSYDKLNSSYFLEESGLANGQQFNGEFTKVKNVNRSNSEVTAWENKVANYNITDSESKDVTKNYKITENFGYVTVLPRKLFIVTSTQSWVYDAKQHESKEYTLTAKERDSGLVDSHELKLKNYTTITDVVGTADEEGEVNNELTFDVSDGENVNVTNNYEFVFTLGTLKITRKLLTATTGSLNEVYDGKAKSKNEVKLEGIVDGQNYSISSSKITYITDVGTVNNVIDFTYSVYVSSLWFWRGQNDTTNNYKISKIVNGTLTVTQRPVSIETDSKTWVYDGKEHSETGISVVNDDDNQGLVSGHRLEAETNSPKTIKDAGEAENNYDFTPHVYAADGTDKTSNYNITVKSHGKLVVTQREITVLTNTHSWVYDGKEHEDTGYTVANLVEGHTFTPDTISPVTIKTKGEASNNLSITSHIYDENNKEVTKNYSITINYGTLYINLRPINIETLDQSFVYDGTEHSFNERDKHYRLSTGENEGLAEGHELSATFASAKEVNRLNGGSGYGTYKNEIKDIKITANGEDVTENYSISTVFGNITVLPRPLKITTESEEWTYDGKEHELSVRDTDYTLSTGENEGLVNGHTLQAEYTKVKDVLRRNNGEVDTYTNQLDNVKITDGAANADDVTSNYEITYENGLVKILPRDICFTTTSAETIEYDGKDHDLTSSVSVTPTDDKNGLVNSHTYKFDKTEVRDVNLDEDGKVIPYVCEMKNIRILAGSEDVTKNYNVQHTWAQCTITKHHLNLTTQSSEWVYDGTVHTDSEKVSSNVQLMADQTYTAEFEHRINAGNYENDAKITIKEGERDVTFNYEIEIAKGKIKISERPIEFKTHSKIWVVFDDSFSYTYDKLNEGFEIVSKNANEGLASDHTVSAQGTPITQVTDTETEVKYVENKLTFKITDKSGQDVTKNYTVTCTKRGHLRVKLGVVIEIWNVIAQYDGESHTFENDDYTVTQLPPDVKESEVHVTPSGTLTEAGSISLDTLKNEWKAEIVHQKSIRATSSSDAEFYPEDINEIRFTGSDNPLQVTKRKIIVTSSNLSKKRDTTQGDLKGSEAGYSITSGNLVENHKIEVVITGVLSHDEEGPVANTIGSVTIKDADGKDVTKNYEIETRTGLLSWL